MAPIMQECEEEENRPDQSPPRYEPKDLGEDVYTTD
jgi:hypothetical protein